MTPPRLPDAASGTACEVPPASLLRAGLPITMVAAQAGFYDQAHLTQHFKRIVGLTPGRYLR
jgi:AraC-like DNA-binding protein